MLLAREHQTSKTPGVERVRSTEFNIVPYVTTDYFESVSKNMYVTDIIVKYTVWSMCLRSACEANINSMWNTKLYEHLIACYENVDTFQDIFDKVAFFKKSGITYSSIYDKVDAETAFGELVWEDRHEKVSGWLP